MFSAKGQGSRFTIYLPLIGAAEGVAQEEEGEVPDGRGETVLVVEDEASVVVIVKAMLNQLNYRALTARNGREALAVYDAHRDEIALVITDVMMPEMGGVQLFEALGARDSGVPVVMMTGYPIGDASVRLPGGIAGLLEKPLEMMDVAQVLKKALDSVRPN